MLSFIAERAQEEATALVRPGGERMSYATLAMATSAVMQALGERVGDVAHRIVGVAVEEGAGSLASVLAVLEAGGVVLPLDLRRGIPALELEAARARALAVIVGDAAEDRLEVVAVDASRRQLVDEACLLVDAGGRRAVHSRAGLGVGVDAIVQALGLSAAARVPLGGSAGDTTTLLTALATLRAGGSVLLGGAPGANVELPAVVDTAEALRVAVVGAGGLEPLPGVELRGEAGDALVEVHAPATMLGYLDDPEATRAAFVERDGRRFVRARAVDRVDPAALERVLAATPGVREAAALVVRDAAGERGYAFVAGDATAVPRHPARVVVLDSLPRRSDGAVDREALRRMATVD